MAWNDSSTSGGKSLDLLVISLIAAVSLVYGLEPGFTDSTARVVVGLVFVLFAPGYALVSVLLPLSASSQAYNRGVMQRPSGELLDISVGERIVLSVGLSVILVPLIGILLDYTSFGVRPRSILITIGVLTLVLSALATVRRWRFGPDRFGISFRRGTQRMRERIVVRGARQETILNVVLIAGILLAVAGVGLAVATSGGGERYTEFYLLAEEPESGELVADEYPDELTMGEPAELHVGIANQQQEQITYTVVVQLQRLERRDGEAVVVERSQLDTFETTLEHGASRERPHTFEPSLEGENLRLTYLLYVDQPPEGPSTDTAHRSAHLWVSVAAGDE